MKLKNQFMYQYLIRVIQVLFLTFFLMVFSYPLFAESNEQQTQQKPENTIKIEHSRKIDNAIRDRLKEIYSEMNGLHSLSVSVSNGIVTLTGKVASQQAEEKALELAEQIEGVVEVDNQLTVSQSVIERSQFILDKVTKLGKRALESLPLFLLAIFVFWVFWRLGRWVSQKQKILSKISTNDFIAELMGKLLHLVFIILGLVLALSLMDATALLGTILGAAGIFGLALSFAVRDTVENFIASVLLSIRNPFDVNDYISIEEYEGNVARLTSRATLLISPEGNYIRIPNATVFKAIITNFTRKPQRRFQFDIGIAPHHSVSEAQNTALTSISKIPGILSDPKPVVLLDQIGESSINLRIFAWMDQRKHDFLKIRSESIKMVKESFDQAGIVIPSPEFLVKLSKESTLDTKQDDSLAKPEKRSVSSTNEEIGDTSADTSISDEIDQQNIQDSGEGESNLLSKSAKNE